MNARISILLTLLMMFGSRCLAQTDADSATPREVVELTVSPAAEPDPIFRHRFTVMRHNTIAGNAAITYLNAIADGSFSRKYDALSGQYPDAEWVGGSGAIAESDRAAVIQAAATFDQLVDTFIVRATKQRRCDWQFGLEDAEGSQLLNYPLGSVQSMRTISRVLLLQTRAAILQNDYDRAVDLIRMNLQLGQNISQSPSLVSALVGFAGVGLAIESVERLVQADGSPNLYWALTELPTPIIDARRALRTEIQWTERLLPELAEANRQHTDEEWKALFQKLPVRFIEITQSFGPRGAAGNTPNSLRRAIPLAIGFAAYRAAKKRLIAGGKEKSVVEAMSVSEVLLKDIAIEVQRSNDWFEKQIYFPQRMEGSYDQRISELENDPARSISNLAYVLTGALLPAIEQVRNAGLRVDRNIAALRVVEAIRMQAAVTKELPNSLDAISVVPVPNNPATGKPFEYSLNGDVATLDLPDDGLNLWAKRYLIRLQSK